MTIEECYEKIGGNYATITARLCTPALIGKFIAKFLEDDSFEKLCAGIRDGECQEAFRAAHTLKGICQNLEFGTLLVSVDKLTEVLRPATDKIPESAPELLEDVRQDYEWTVAAIRSYIEEKE